MAYRYLGYGITNDKGIAKLEFDANGNPIDHSYTGTGAGELDIIASLDDNTHISDSSIQSETYDVWDYIFYDTGIDGTKNTNWYSSNVTPVPDTEGTLLQNTVPFTYRGEQIITGDFEAKVYVFDIIGGVRVGITSNDKNTRGVIYNPRYIKIRRENGVVTISASTDGINYGEISYDMNEITTEDCYFYFYSFTSGGVNRAIKYKDLKIYPI